MSSISSNELPRKIKPLDPQLVNRIAAGEIIQRPFNALKELIENCLDAGSTQINIQIRDGGLKLMHITDNGCGIDKDDLKIVCERFTTSKLKEFEDLKSINTFGFRGEALASISHVARLTIITRTASSPCAFKAMYTDGKLSKEGIKPTATASKGTQIIVEDLFYNSTIRRNALRSGSEEFAKIYECVSRYAIHNYHVSFTLKRIGESSFDLKTNGCFLATGSGRCLENETFLLDVIGTVNGSELRKELERVEIPHDDNYKFSMLSYMSNSKYTQLKQITFILFINERLVDCQPIKKSLQSLFSLYLPKNSNPFIYMSLTIDARNLDVNIHPTKHEVRFLYQDEIIARIQTCFEEKLLNSDVSRTFRVKNLTIEAYVRPGGGGSDNKKDSELKEDLEKPPKGGEGVDENSEESSSKKPIYPYKLTRVDTKERKLDSYFHSTPGLDESIRVMKEKSSQENKNSQKNCKSQEKEDGGDNNKSMLRMQRLERDFNFLSLRELRGEVEATCSQTLKKLLGNMSFVGCLDRELALVQHETGLFVMNTHILSTELFYQIALFNFGNFGYLKLDDDEDSSTRMSIKELVRATLDDPRNQWEPDDGDKDELASRCSRFLYKQASMLDDYFSIKLVKLGESSSNSVYLTALPILLEDYEPNLVDLPRFLIRLATEVDWDSEKECFESICQELAQFYSIKNLNYKEEDESTTTTTEQRNQQPGVEWIVEHVLFKAFVNMLLPSMDNEKRISFRLVDLSTLYKVFERC